MTNQNVANNPIGSYPVKVTRVADSGLIQHMRIDIGSGTAESVVTSANPLPVDIVSGGGGITAGTPTETAPNVTTSSSTVLASNASRKAGYLVNESDTDIYVSFGSTATTAKQKIRANGGSLSFTVGGIIFQGNVNAIHAGTGSKALYVVEFV